jgi:hypothetical protein
MKHLLKKNSLTIRGAGGGGGGGAPAPPGPVAVQMYPAVLAPPLMGQTNYISSFSYAEIVDLISDGPIEGLVNQDNKKVYGADIFEGIFLNGVPVKETSRINSEELDISFLKKELKDFWQINEGDLPIILNKKIFSQKTIAPTHASLINNPFFSGPITITSWHPEDSLFQLINSLNLNLDSLKLAQRAFDAISINDERPFLTKINIPTFTVPIADFKFDKSFFGLTDKTYGLDLEISNIGQYIYFTVDSENLNSNQYSEIPRTFIKYNGYSQPEVLKNNVSPLVGYSAQKFDNVDIYIWSIYGKYGVKDISKAVDRYFNKITIRQRLPGQYNYNLIKSEFKNGAEVQYPLQNFKNVEIDIQHDKELIGPFKIKNDQKVTSAKSCNAGGVTRLTDLTTVEENSPVVTNLENETSDDVRYIKNWPIEYDSAGNPLLIKDINFNYAVFDKTSKNRVEQPAIPVTHYIDNNNVEEVYVTLTLNNLSDTNHIDLTSAGYGTKPGYTEEPYKGTLTYAELINQNAITNSPVKISERYIVGVNIASFIPWSEIFPKRIGYGININEAQYPFVEKFARDIAINGYIPTPTKTLLFGINLNYLQNENFIVNNLISVENLNSLLEKYYLYRNIDFQTFLSDFDGGKLIGYSKIVDLANPYEEYDLAEAKTTFVYNETNAFNIFTSSEATTFGNGIYLSKNLFKNTSTHDYVFKYKLTPKEVNANLSLLPSRTSSDLGNSFYNRKQQITAGTKLPSTVSIRIDTGYETNECSNYASDSDFFSYRFDIYGLANDPSKIDIGRRNYDFVRGQRSLANPRAGVYAVTKADSIVPFHLFKVTESGRAPNYYISNSRDFGYNDVNFAKLNPFSYLVENIQDDITGEIRVYYPTGENFEGDIECCFSGNFTGIIICGSGNCYLCEVCVLNENGMFGLQTSGYLSLEDFESKIILDGGLKIPEVLKTSMFDDYKLNMSTALPELKKLNYLNFSNFSSPYNFIECSYSLKPLENCYNIDTYKFNSENTNTCVQVCSFDLDIFNVFSENNKVTTPKTSYSFSIFRVNGNISTTQFALNKLGYKYVILNIDSNLNKYVLIYLPDGKNSNTFVREIIDSIGKNIPSNQTTKISTCLSVLARSYYYSQCSFYVNVPSDILTKSNWSSIISNCLSARCTKPEYHYNSFIFRETSTEQIGSYYFVNYLPFYYSLNNEIVVCEANQTSDPHKNYQYWTKYVTKDSAVSLRGYNAASSSYYEVDWVQENDLPSEIDSSLRSFLLSISNDQNIADVSAIINNFKNIQWIARSNSVALEKIRTNNYLFEVRGADNNVFLPIKNNCRLIQPAAYYCKNDGSAFMQRLSSALTCTPLYTEYYRLSSEVAVSNVFTVPVVARNELASPTKTQAISVTAKFWVLYNPNTSIVSVVFPVFSKENNWNELQDQETIQKLPINDFIENLPSTITINESSYARNKDFLIFGSNGLIGYSSESISVPTQRKFIRRSLNTTVQSYGNYNSSSNLGYGAGIALQIGSDNYCLNDNGYLYFPQNRGVYFSNYSLKNNFTTPSIDKPLKNLKILGRKKEENETILDVVLDLLTSSSLGNDAVPKDASFASKDASPKHFISWVNNSYWQTYASYPIAPRGSSLFWKDSGSRYSSSLNIYYYEVALSNFSTSTQNIYANDVGQQILLPPPKLDLSGSPIRRYVKITKLSYETLSPLISKRISVGTVTEIIPQTFSYPFSAIVGTKIDARSFAQMPSRSFHCKLKKVLVPSNYYPNNPKDESDIRYDVTQVGLHKIYDGDWDGTFKLMWTDNPAWILMDMLVNKRYGLGNHIAPEQIDIWELYQVARWCDGVNDDGYYYGVPDSYGGVEPRHTFNALIGDKFNVFDMINQIASVFRGHVYYMNSLITFDDDRPKPPIGEFANADVKDGLFNYTNMKKDDEFTVVEVAFVDAKNDYRSSIEYVENADAIRKRGILKKQMNAFGVTSRGQARRIGKHFLHQSSKENLNVSFTTDMKALLYKPGDLITIHDELLNSHKNFGSVKAIEEVPNSGDLFKVVIDQALNSGVYNDGIITLYSAMTKPKYSDMQEYLGNGSEYKKVTVNFLQPLISSFQDIGQKIRNEHPCSFAIKNGVTSNQITYGYANREVSSKITPINYDGRAKTLLNHRSIPLQTRWFIPNYLDYINSKYRYFEPFFDAWGDLYKDKRPIFSIKDEIIIPYADVGFGCLAAPNNYLFPPFLASIDGNTIAQPCKVFGKDCLFVLMNSGKDYCAVKISKSLELNSPNYVLSGISYIKYPCSDMEVYTSRISGLPVYVETGNKIKNEVCLFYPSGNKFDLYYSNDFLFTGSIKFKYYTYNSIKYITGRHQLCDYTKPVNSLNDAEYLALEGTAYNCANLNYYSLRDGSIMVMPYCFNSSTFSYDFAFINPILCYKLMDNDLTVRSTKNRPLALEEMFDYLYSRYTISGLPKLQQNCEIFFPALMYFCVSENKTSYYLDGMNEIIDCIPISLQYVENDAFCDLITNSSLTPKLKGHWSITVGTGFSDVLELDWIGNESEKIKSNIYEILNNGNCFRFSKFSGIVSGEPVYFAPTGFSKAELYSGANFYSQPSCYCVGLYEEPFEQRSGIYSGFNNLYLFSQMTGTDFVLNYPKNHIPSEANKDSLPQIVSEPLNETYLSGLRELLCQCFNLGKPYYPAYNTGLITSTAQPKTLKGRAQAIYTGLSTYSSSQNENNFSRKKLQNLLLDNFQNFTPRMIVDFTGYNFLFKYPGPSIVVDNSNPIKYNYSYFQRTFAYFYTGLITSCNFNDLNIQTNGLNDLRLLTLSGLNRYNEPINAITYNVAFSNFIFLCSSYLPPFNDLDTFFPISGKFKTTYEAKLAGSSLEEINTIDLNPYDSPQFTRANPVSLYSFARCQRGYLSNLMIHTIPNEKSIAYSKIIENDRPSVEAFCIHDYITGYNQASGYDESISTNTYTEIYLCKTNQFGVVKDSIRNGLGNFCVGSLYSLQILNKTAPIFKIMSITENYINEYNIFATQYKEEKFLEIEENVQVDSLDNTFNALYYYQSASRLTQKNEPLKSPIILSIDYVQYSNAPALNIKWQPASEHIKDYTKYRIYVQSPSKQTPNLQIIVGDENFNSLNNYFEYNYQGDGIINPLTKEIGNYTVSIEVFYEKDGVYVFSTPTKRSINVLNY